MLKSLLGASVEESEADRIRRSGLPRSTYLEAKQRIYSGGLLADRYVPSPQAITLNRISFLLTRPFADKRSSVAQVLLSTPGSVLVWTGVHVQLGVVLHRTQKDLRDFENTIAPLIDGGSLIAHLRVNPSREEIPIYFDFEGLWSSFVGSPGVRKYPRGFPAAAQVGAPGLDGPVPQNGPVADLLRDHVAIDEEGPSTNLLSPHSLPRSRRRVLEDGLVEWRTFLSTSRSLAFADVRLTDMILVVGKRIGHRNISRLLESLMSECGAFPFLLVGDEEQLFLGFMGAGLGSSRASSQRSGKAVAGTIAQFVSNMEVLRENLGEVSLQRDHQYEYLLQA